MQSISSIISNPRNIYKKNKMKKKGVIMIFSFFLWISLIIIPTVIGFRLLRNHFPPAEITGNRIVGFSQFNGYPLYFDSLLIYFLITSTIFVFIFYLIISYVQKKFNKKN